MRFSGSPASYRSGQDRRMTNSLSQDSSKPTTFVVLALLLSPFSTRLDE